MKREKLLVAIDGVNGHAVRSAAKSALASMDRSRRGGISFWDASGIFDEAAVAGEDAGLPSVRTLLLLYAADLAFRLRWQIRPALAEGQVVIAAPYVATAVALGRAAGLPQKWISDLFQFAPVPARSEAIDVPQARRSNARDGFVEFSRRWIAGRPHGLTSRQVIDRARLTLRGRSR